MSPMMTLAEAQRALLNAAWPATESASETLPLTASLGRVLADEVVSLVNVPPMDNSAMDGYACRHADFAMASAAGLPVRQRIAAGDPPTSLFPGSAARIFTGAALPAGADTVVMQEDVVLTHDQRIRITKLPAKGAWVRRIGEELTVHQTALAKGTRLNAAHLGVAAAAGHARLPVFAKKRVGLLQTGNELYEPGEPLPAGGIYNSNRVTILSLLSNLAVEAIDLGVAADNRQDTERALSNAALHCDLIITTGGVSVGEEDHVKAAIEACGELAIWRVAMKPGKPLAFGRLRRPGGFSHVIGLPGNPVSAMVTFMLLVRPFIRHLQGEPLAAALPGPGQWLPSAMALAADSRLELVRVSLTDSGGLIPFASQSSSLLTSMANSHGLAFKPADTEVGVGDLMRFLAFSELGL